MNYLVSVIIPVYNTEQYLAECLESVLSQHILGVRAIECIEIIVIDDGSPDNSIGIIQNYKKYTAI
ncbi:glycosyltransferase family 2 protein [Cronobacter dublinensis]|uniref:glycosyltransferase family 2 protein n=1 Tax=Cronobacter dublinensis TaxID=413497 RepID=UPI0022341054|nr:glycosyltransferase [Cronobacter dublinensis]